MVRSKRSKRIRSKGFGTAQFKKARPSQVCHFTGTAFGTVPMAEFEEEDGNAIAKRALIMVEGSHTDSNKRPHEFSADRIYRIAENTNRFLEEGGRIPWQQDHDKTQKANLGDLEDFVEVRPIEEDDLPNPRLKHLVGRLGIFADRLVARGKDIVDQVMAGRIKTLSPGIDVATDVIREISATPTPAIVGLSVFKRANFALTWEDAEAEEADMDAMQEEYQEYCDNLWTILTSIGQAGEDELQGQDPQTFVEEAIAGFNERVYELLFGKLPDDEEDESESPVPPGSNDPNYLQKQQQKPQPGQPSANMSRRLTLAEMAIARREQRAEFKRPYKRRRR